MLLIDVYNQFSQNCITATSLIRISNIFYDNRINFAGEIYSSEINDCIINGAFLLMFMTFEEFLEKSFICYVSIQPERT